MRTLSPSQNLISGTRTGVGINAPWTVLNGLTVTSLGDSVFDLTDANAGAIGSCRYTDASLVTPGITYTLTVHVEKAASSASSFIIDCGTARCTFDRFTGDAITSGTASINIARVQDAGTYWIVSHTFNIVAGATSMTLSPLASASNNTGTVRIRNVQLTKCSGPSIYVATDATAVDEGTPRGQMPSLTPVTVTTGAFFQPAIGSDGIVTVASSAKMFAGQTIVLVGGGTYLLTVVHSATVIQIRNMGSSNAVAAGGAVPGSLDVFVVFAPRSRSATRTQASTRTLMS